MVCATAMKGTRDPATATATVVVAEVGNPLNCWALRPQPSLPPLLLLAGLVFYHVSIVQLIVIFHSASLLAFYFQTIVWFHLNLKLYHQIICDIFSDSQPKFNVFVISLFLLVQLILFGCDPSSDVGKTVIEITLFHTIGVNFMSSPQFISSCLSELGACLALYWYKFSIRIIYI